jgi:DNA-binding FadR family transcriptional regulator
MPFSKLKISQKPSLVDQVEEKLLNYFKEMNLKPGDTLSGEIELKEALGVGRSVLREALSRFRMVGLIKSKPGIGMILCEPELFSGLERVMNPYLLSKAKLIDLLKFRVLIELGAVDFIFDNVTDKDIKVLEDIVNSEILFANNRYDIKSDYHFHVKLLEISGNNSVKDFQKVLYPLFEFTQNNYDQIFNEFRDKNKDYKEISHKELVELIKKGDRDGYRNAIGDHLKIYSSLNIL